MGASRSYRSAWRESQCRNGHWFWWGMTSSPGVLDNSYFEVLLTRQWTKRTNGGFESGTLRMVSTDIAIRTFPELRAVAEEFAESNEVFLSAVSSAWSKIMNAD